MVNPPFFAPLTAIRHPHSLRADRGPTKVWAVAAALLLLLGAVVVPAPAAARCLPVADRQAPPPVGFAALGAKYPALGRRRPAAGGPSPSARAWPVNGKGKTERGPALPQGVVELTFLGHSSFLIRTHANATAITDYNGYVRAPFAPDIVTMNRAHDTHYTNVVEAGVKHVLRGWMEKGVIPRHDVTVQDLRVTNVPTDIRPTLLGDAGIAGNSIFIFESAGLCIVHLGHLHHRLLSGHAGRVGTVDVLLAPIDDSFTMAHSELVQVIDVLKPEVVIPMHYGYGGTLERFLALMRVRKFAIRMAKTHSARFAKVTLPPRQTVLVLESKAY